MCWSSPGHRPSTPSRGFETKALENEYIVCVCVYICKHALYMLNIAYNKMASIKFCFIVSIQ